MARWEVAGRGALDLAGAGMRTSSRDGTFHGCRLTRGSLEEIIRILTSDATDRARLRIEAEQGINRVAADNLADFLSELDEPSHLDNLDIQLSDSDRLVRISMSAIVGDVELSVVGSSETWVRGRYEELAHKLRRTRRALAYSQGVVMMVLWGILASVVVVLGLTLDSKQALLSGDLAAAAVMSALAVLLFRRGKSVVQLTDSRSAWSGMTVFNLTVGVASVLLMAASLWVGWAAWQHPVK
ncbi:hypothetical protein [Streptomyces sp. 6-11-2]|uniref:hypothetical protein n=1 Tax=Streptomyces sp. 6-11-2 TaxID=2585753 RepID=UPI0011421552|nr:hypothetical protein [Streptomyces sp. 6-11-2]